VNHRIVPALGHHRLDRLQPEHVEAFYGELLDEGLSSATVLQMHRILSRPQGRRAARPRHAQCLHPR